MFSRDSGDHLSPLTGITANPRVPTVRTSQARPSQVRLYPPDLEDVALKTHKDRPNGCQRCRHKQSVDSKVQFEQDQPMPPKTE